MCPIVERLCCSMMMHGRNNGKKLMAVRIVKHAFEIINLLADKNPIQVYVDAVKNGGPREDSTRIGSAGVVRRQAVDVPPLRRVNQAIYLICTGGEESAAAASPRYALSRAAASLVTTLGNSEASTELQDADCSRHMMIVQAPIPIVPIVMKMHCCEGEAVENENVMGSVVMGGPRQSVLPGLAKL